MAAMIWYASRPEMRTKPGIFDLAIYFCRDMADHLNPASSPTRRIGQTKDTTVYKLAKRIMTGEYAWVEDGILPLLDTQRSGERRSS
jgi:hypothetical protein